MEEYIQAFCNYRREKKQVSENTMLAYRSDLQRMITYLRRNGITSVEQITETQLNSFILAAEWEGLKASSVVIIVNVFFIVLPLSYYSLSVRSLFTSAIKVLTSLN
mgnify:CR=1 FL=1